MKTHFIVIAVVLLLSGCGGRSAPQQPPAAQATPAPAAPSPAAPAEQEVTIKLTEFKFEPGTVEVKAGQVKFELENSGTVEHNFVIVGTNNRIEAIPPGKKGELAAALRPGSYRIECDVPGHKEAGMTMTLVVK